MDFRKLFLGLACLFLLVIFFTNCSPKNKSNINNTFYIELINFSKDSLKKNISDGIFGKASYYKNNKLIILSVNYLNDNFPQMHFFKNIEELKNNIQEKTKKIRIEFKGECSVYSINYSMEKYIYKDKKWVKISDMGIIKGNTSYKRTKEFTIKEFGKQIINNTVEYTYN